MQYVSSQVMDELFVQFKVVKMGVDDEEDAVKQEVKIIKGENKTTDKRSKANIEKHAIAGRPTAKRADYFLLNLLKMK